VHKLCCCLPEIVDSILGLLVQTPLFLHGTSHCTHYLSYHPIQCVQHTGCFSTIIYQLEIKLSDSLHPTCCCSSCSGQHHHTLIPSCDFSSTSSTSCHWSRCTNNAGKNTVKKRSLSKHQDQLNSNKSMNATVKQIHAPDYSKLMLGEETDLLRITICVHEGHQNEFNKLVTRRKNQKQQKQNIQYSCYIIGSYTTFLLYTVICTCSFLP